MTINPHRTRAVWALLLLAASCTEPPPPPAKLPPPAAPRAQPPLPPPPPPPPPLPPPAVPPRATDWRDLPLPAGDWFFAKTAQGSLARFGLAGAIPLASLECNRARGEISLILPGQPAGAGPWPADIAAATTSGTFTAESYPTGGVAATAIRFPASARMLDAMAFSRGRFRIGVAGLAPLVLPAWSEVGRVIEDCRSPDPARASDSDNK